MQERPPSSRKTSARRHTNGAVPPNGAAEVVKPVDRSGLLRRVEPFPFQPSRNGGAPIRLRRKRRVCDCFSAIPRLARMNGH